MSRLVKIIVLCLVLTIPYVSAQTLNTPEVYSFKQEVFSPVSMYTGQANISIPITQVQTNEITVPITLNYVGGAGFRPGNPYSSVGMGWRVSAGGAITRTKNFVCDECPNFSNYPAGFFSLSPNTINPNDVRNKVDSFFSINSSGPAFTPTTEYSPDVFSFSFLGYSGYFIMGYDGEFKIQSQNIVHVEKISDGSPNNFPGSYNGLIFKLTANDGTVFTFGGKVGATELSGGFPDPNNQNSITSWQADAWYLTQIKSVSNQTVEFNYQSNTSSVDAVRYIPSIESNYAVKSTSPVVLNTIQFDGGQVVFTSSAVTQTISYGPSTPRMISKIELKDSDNNSVTTADFTYSESGSTRYYFLDSLVVNDKLYSFAYYGRNSLPNLDVSLRQDYWGFYNDREVVSNHQGHDANYWDELLNATQDDLHRLPYLETTKLGVLTSITYPTGGVETYEYELNTYSKKGVQKPTGRGYSNETSGPKAAGGLRIARITLGDMVRKYKYTNTFDPNNASTESSGILYKSPGVPYYSRTVLNGVSIDGEPPVVYGKVFEILADNSYTEYTMRSPLYYPDPDDTGNDSTYFTWFSNTNFPGPNRIPGFVGNLGKSSSKSLERGQVSLIRVFDSGNNLKKQVAYTYATDPARTNQNVPVLNFTSTAEKPLAALGLELGTVANLGSIAFSIINSFAVYTYPVFLEKEVETVYESGQALVKTTDYKYNPQKLRSEVIVTNSKGETLQTKIKYPADLSLGNYPAMAARKMLNFPIEQVQLKDTLVIGGTITTYKSHSSGSNTYYVPYQKYVGLTSSVPESGFVYFDGATMDSRYYGTPQIRYDSYNSLGNVLQTTTRDGMVTSFLWDTFGRYPMAEVKGIGYSSISAQDNKSATYSSSALFSSLNTLAPSALIKTYSYKPLVGIESVTDASGKLTWYNYDSFGRLADIREGNSNGNLVKSFEYNYGLTGGATGSTGISRILIVGNSITKLIAQTGGDGWQSSALTAAGGWGRASSTQANDFAHILESRFKTLNAAAKVLPLWEAPFERDYLGSPAGWLTYDFTALQNRILTGFSGEKPELVIIRLGENVVNAEVEVNDFKTAYKELIDKVLEVSEPNAKVIVTNSMWPDQPLADAKILEVANERGLPFVDLSDMISNPIYLAGNDPATLTAFPNNTGDRHPGDAGMLEIADRIWSKVNNTVLPSNIGGNITKVRLYPRTDCCIENIVGSVIQGSNDTSNTNGWTTLATINETPSAGWNEYAIRTTTAWRYLRFLAGPNCSGELKELEFYNGNSKLNGLKFGSTTALNNNSTNYGYAVIFDGLISGFWHGTSPGPQNYAGIDQGAGCSALTASILSPANNASVVGTASTTTSGRVTTAISVMTCVPVGTQITSVEVWATTTTGGWPNRMGYAVADPSQPGVYTLSAEEGNANGKWPIAYLDPGAFRFYAVVNTGTTSLTTDYITITLTAPSGTGCSALTASVLSPVNNATVAGTASTTTAGRVTTAISIATCVSSGTTISSVEVWAATSTGGWPNRMGYAVADTTQPGVYTLSAEEGTADGKWPIAYLDPGTFRFYAVVNTGTTSLTTDYITITLTAPTGTGCSALTASVLSPVNNATVVGTASTTTSGRVTTAISVTTCVPSGTTISSVEVWAATSTGGWPNRMGYAVADPNHPGIYTLSTEEGSADGKWPIAYLDPGTFRFYAVVNTGATSLTTDYITITLTAPTGTGCSALAASVLSPANNASVVGNASTTTSGRVTTAISVTTCVPSGTTISSVEVWAATSTGGWPNRMGYAVAVAGQPGLYMLSAEEGSADGKWPIAYLDPGTFRFYAVVNTGTTSLTTDYITITLTAPTGTGCSALAGSVLFPANNASLVGNASTTTSGRVTTAISVTTCVPSGSAISSVEVWAATSTGGWPNRMGYAVADPNQPGVYTLSAEEGTADGKWPIAYLDPGTYRFYAVINTGTTSLTTDYITITLAAPTGCSALTASILSPANNASVVGNASTTTAGRVTTAISVMTCVPSGTTISSVEVWATTATGGWPNRMGYAVADPTQPGVYTLSAEEGSVNGKWPIPYLDPGTYRFYAVINTGTTSLTTDYNTITLTAPTSTGCSALTASILSPTNNSSVVGTASTTTAGRVTTAISVMTCIPNGVTISSVEVWATTTTGGWPNRMGYAVPDPGQPGVYTLSAEEGSANGKWPIAYLDPGTFRFYAVINTGTTSLTTDYSTITLTAPTSTGCSALTASVFSPVNNASVVGNASTTTAGRVTTAISVATCVPSGTTISSVEVWAATSTGGWPNRMGYAVADPNQPGVYTLSAEEGSADGKWPIAYLDPGTFRFYAVVNTGTTSLTTDYITITLTAPTGTGCSALTASVLSPSDNASVVGTASTTTAGRVTTAISVTTCVPSGSAISSVEIWAATTTGGWPNRMGYAVADPNQPGVYTLSAEEGSADGKWPIAYLDPGTFRFYAVVNTGTTSLTTAYNTITLTAPTSTGCSALTASVLSPTNNASVVGTASTTTAGRVTTAISVTTCVPSGGTISSVEIWAATSTGEWPNRMGYAVADPSQPGVYTLSAEEGSANGKWPIAYLNPGTYRFYAVVNTGTTSLTTAYNTITITAPTGCSALTASVLSPTNNASVVGTASTTTAGRVTTAISVTTCVPSGTTISSVEIWAATSTGGWPNRMGYAVANPSQPGVYTLSAEEGSANGKWPIAYLDPGTFRFYAVVNTGTTSLTTDYITITLTAPTGTGCPALTANVLSPVNNASVVGTPSTTTSGRVTTAISIATCVPSGTTISSVEVWAATSTGGWPNRMGYAVPVAGQPGVYRLSAEEGSADGKWPIAYLDPGTYRFYAVINTGTTSLTTAYNTITLTAP